MLRKRWLLPMPYGPVVLLGLIPAAWVSMLNVLLAVYFLKLEWLAAYGASAWLLLRILQRISAERAYGLFLFALNPLHGPASEVAVAYTLSLVAHPVRCDVSRK